MDADATHGTGASYGNRLLEAETHQSADLERPDLTPRSAEVTVHIHATGRRRASTVPKNDRDTNTMRELLHLLLSSKRPELKRFTDSLPQNSKFSEISCAFHNHCGPLILENEIIGPDSWHSASSDKETKKQTKETKTKQHKYTGPEHPHLFEADGIYKGELENGNPNGWGLWVSFSSFEQHFEVSIAADTYRKGFQDPISVTILWGNWKDMELTQGSMLHACVPDMNGPFWPVRRCVGFSYKGRLSLGTLNYQQKKPKKGFELKFDCNDQENSAIFREFEFTAIKMALPKTKQGDPEFPLQVWVELFYDSLLDDGFERKGCRNYGEHRKIFEQTPKELELALGDKDLALALSAKAKEMADKAVDKPKANAMADKAEDKAVTFETLRTCLCCCYKVKAETNETKKALETPETIALPVTTIYEDPEFPLQVWVELFYASLLDDGLVRKGCRNYGEHRKIFEQTTPKELELALGDKDLALALSAKAKAAAMNAGFIEFLTSNYIGAGLQYFVPRIVDGTHAHFELGIALSYCQLNTNTIALFLCHICNYS